MTELLIMGAGLIGIVLVLILIGLIIKIGMRVLWWTITIAFLIALAKVAMMLI